MMCGPDDGRPCSRSVLFQAVFQAAVADLIPAPETVFAIEFLAGPEDAERPIPPCGRKAR
jgi:hypothetical protein